MPAKYCFCPDGEKREIGQCLTQCPLGDRCLTEATLIKVFAEREWMGTPSTTQLLNGTRLEYLKLTKVYAIDPQDRAFALLGTQHHQMLEKISAKLNCLAEERLSGEVMGVLDLLEPDPLSDGDEYVLIDYKTWGSYKVAKAIGIYGVKVPDPRGGVYQKSGNWGKAGDPKMITEWREDPDKADNWEAELQLNNYRLLAEAAGFPISRMKLQVTVRDGGTINASSNGVLKRILMIPVKRLPDDEVKDYFAWKKEALLSALEGGVLPSACSSRENWDGSRCAGYCEVVDWCPEGLAIKRRREGGE